MITWGFSMAELSHDTFSGKLWLGLGVSVTYNIKVGLKN